jgi:hypothetical protein
VRDRSGIEELEKWLGTLVPRCELIARMALSSCLPELRIDPRDDRRWFTRTATLINELNLSHEDLNEVRADAQKVQASLRGGLLRATLKDTLAWPLSGS